MKIGTIRKYSRADRITAPEAVGRSVCCAIRMNRMMGAPPGSITKGSLAPIPAGPKDWIKVPMPQTRKVALSS